MLLAYNCGGSNEQSVLALDGQRIGQAPPGKQIGGAMRTVLKRLNKTNVFLLLVIALIVGVSLTRAQQISFPGSAPQTQITSLNQAIAATTTVIALSAPSSKIQVWTSSNAANLYINPNGTAATASNAIIYPGGSETFTVYPPASQIQVMGASAAGTVNVLAN